MKLAEQLGYGNDEVLLIINADDYGLCHSVNQSVQQLLAAGAVSSATLMTPCAWAREAALWSASNKHLDVGVHFTFTSEWEPYKWGPVTTSGNVSSLVTEEGYFPAGTKAFEETADAGQVRLELISQLERALSFGMTPTHADNHMGSLYGLATGRHFLAEVLEVCAEYGLPFRLPRYVTPEQGGIAPPEMEEQAKAIAALADAKGVVILDYLVGLPFHKGEEETYDSFKADMKHLLASLKPGVTELIIHPSLAAEELDAFHAQPEKRVMEHHLFLDEDMTAYMKERGITLIRWRELQQLQRGQKAKDQS
jgi:predicted glycoside hydrolase/deacetylase ChbG (UPF0249 family)